MSKKSSMFVSHDINSNKKNYKKPNILRMKRSINKVSTVSKINKTDIFESSGGKSLLTSSCLLDQQNNDLQVDKLSKYKTNISPMATVNKSMAKLKDETEQNYSDNLGSVQNIQEKNMIYIDGCQNFQGIHNEPLNVESFLLNDHIKQNITIYDNSLLKQQMEDGGNQKWCLDFTQDSQKIIIEHYDNSEVSGFYIEQKPDVTSTMVPLAAVSSIQQNDFMPSDDIVSIAPTNLGLRETDGKDNFQTMTITSVPTTSDSSVGARSNYPTLSIKISEPMHTPDNSYIDKDKDISSMADLKNISMEQLTHRPVKYKCDEPDCKKEFMSEPKLKKHKNTHNKTSSPKAPRLTTLECPVKKVLESGSEESCGRIFHIRVDLSKHLNEEHTIDEAAYRCVECGRRFFWASGLRAHARAHAGSAHRLLACPWPGCPRAFRQPCRLREHARAHTGDKPYSCRYPNCGWSFRTASKLLRHARRHTGDRRHACSACGRAFLRREHLRDHVARHHSHARRTHDCPHDTCQQTFTNMSSLYMHMKKVHKKEGVKNSTTITATIEEPEPPKVEPANLFMVSLLDSSVAEGGCGEERGCGEEGVCGEYGGCVAEVEREEGQSARTHCTWPLTRARYNTDTYVPEEDVQVEQSESSESNIYTVRSDLFLHGNVLNNEDSDQMDRCIRVSEVEGVGDGEGALALDTDLLLDAPSVHLDQEELYTDPADESAFRVFLLSGEELT